MAETMNETQGDVYVRRDVFEARMDRMEMLLEKTVLEIKSYVDKSTGETRIYVEKAIGGLRDEVKSEVGGLKAEVVEAKSEVGGLRVEMKSEISGLRDEVKSEVGGLKAEIVEVKNDVKVLTARVDSMRDVLYWGLALFGIILALATILPAILEYRKKLLNPLPALPTYEELEKKIESIAERVANAVIERRLKEGA